MFTPDEQVNVRWHRRGRWCPAGPRRRCRERVQRERRKDLTFGPEPGEFKVYVGRNANDVQEAKFFLQ